MPLSGEPSKLQIFLGHLDDIEGVFGITFGFPKCNMLLQNWIDWKSNLVLPGERVNDDLIT